MTKIEAWLARELEHPGLRWRTVPVVLLFALMIIAAWVGVAALLWGLSTVLGR